MVRGIEQRALFGDDTDREDFVRRLAFLLLTTQTACFAWALLDNHVHLLVRSGPKGLAHVMRRLLTGYAVWFNRRHRRVGHLFQNRYRSIVCDEERYLLTLVRYIHLNPVRAGIVPDLAALGTYPWCGHSGLMGTRTVRWQATTEVLAQFDATPNRARLEYEAFLRSGLAERLEASSFEDGGGRLSGELPEPIRAQVLGDEAFFIRVQSRLDHEMGPPRPDTRSLVLAVCRALGVPSETIAVTRSRRRDVAIARALIAHLGRDRYRLSGVDLSAALGLSRSAVSMAALRGERLLQQRADLRRVAEMVNN